MQMTFRWFGKEKDTVSLEQIKQIPNVVGVVPALHDLPAGEAWTMDRVQAMYDEITAAGLTMECIESVNVHEDIKIGLPTREKYIENYKESIRNLSKVGVKVICYNFMPVFDWTRTKSFLKNTRMSLRTICGQTSSIFLKLLCLHARNVMSKWQYIRMTRRGAFSAFRELSQTRLLLKSCLQWCRQSTTA